MRTLYHLVIILFSIFLIGALNSCNASKGATQTDHETPEVFYTSIAQILRTQPGLKIQGVGEDITVIIRGERSIHGNNEPLFVLDGIILGNTYREATAGLDPNAIGSVRILTPANAGMFGSRGGNGVIIFTSKEDR